MKRLMIRWLMAGGMLMLALAACAPAAPNATDAKLADDVEAGYPALATPPAQEAYPAGDGGNVALPTPAPGEGYPAPQLPEQPTAKGGGDSSPVYVDEVGLKPDPDDSAKTVLYVKGSLPTPCHVFVYNVNQPDDFGKIQVIGLANAPADRICTQVLEPFEAIIALDNMPSGTFEVYFNDQKAGELTVP